MTQVVDVNVWFMRTKVNMKMFMFLVLQTTRGQFDHPEYSVRRRYQDFLWLRQRLEESYPTHIVPVSSFS